MAAIFQPVDIASWPPIIVTYMKAEPLCSTAGRSINSLTTPDKSTSKPTASGDEDTRDTAPLAVQTADPSEGRGAEKTLPAKQLSANTETQSKAPPQVTPQKSIGTTKPAIPPKPMSLSRPASDKASTPSAPVEPQPSLPVSMIVRPDSADSSSCSPLFPDELEGTFESALTRVELAPARISLVARIWKRIRDLIRSRAGSRRQSDQVRRMVAFDGFRNDLFEDKRERDRRYGTVYTVSEEINAFLIRLELPRRMPASSLKETWGFSDEMPDYAYALNLTDNVLCISAGLPDEARRRLAYVSSSFPSDFQTRIEFRTPIEGYKHRLRNKMLEIIVYKKLAVSPGRSRWQQRQD